MEINVATYIMFIATAYVCNAQDDPCNTAHVLDKMDIRIKTFAAKSTSSQLCDKYRIKKSGEWYRAEGQDLLSKEPGLGELCSTRYPIWMNGDLPKNKGDEKEIEACAVGVRGGCTTKINIKVKKCDGYNVYFLKPPEKCPQAYCFEYSQDGKPPSETVGKPHVSYRLARVDAAIDYQELRFECTFQAKNNDDYLYQIQWFIDDVPAVFSATVPKNLLHLTELGENMKDATKGYQKLNINVGCAVRLKFTKDGPPGPMSNKSSNFFAGIQPVVNRVDIKRGHPTGKIQLKLTVPFGCTYLKDDVEECELEISMNVPGDPKKCKSEIQGINAANRIGRGKNCARTIKNTEWKEIIDIPIAFIDKPEYDLELPDNDDRAFRISLVTGEKEGNAAWGSIQIKNIHVHVSEEDKGTVWKGKSCRAINDPHMRTFDGLSYENQNLGRFVLYRGKSDKYKTEVQFETTPCNNMHVAFCVCAVGVRAGGDVFVIDTCPNKPVRIKYVSCRDNILDARTKSDNEYTIHFPSGTYVQVVIDSYRNMINLHMYPSKGDVDQTLGQCGTLNNNRGDDFMDDKNNKLSREAFNRFWSLKEEDFLVRMSDDQLGKLERWAGDLVYCTCPHEVITGDRPEDIGTCSTDTIVKCAKEDVALNKDKCKIMRRKRSAKRTFSHKINTFKLNEGDLPHETEHIRVKRQENKYTEETARSFCNKYMDASSSFKACSKVPAVHPQEMIENCVKDIMYTQTTLWAAGTREAVRTTCMKELNQNTTLKEEPKDGKPSVAEQVKSVACPNDCSGNGMCENGTCYCEEGFGSNDCSRDLNKPPIVYGVNMYEGGICDIKDGCAKVLVEGYGFINSTDLLCKQEYFFVSANRTKTEIGTISVVKAVHDSVAEIFCPLKKSRRKRETHDSFVEGVTIYVTNNKQNYSEGHTVYLLDSECQDTFNNSGVIEFMLLKGYCFINRNCYQDEIKHPSDECRICNTSINVWQWTDIEDCPSMPIKNVEDKSEFSSEMIIVVVVIVILVVAALIIAVVLFLKRRNNGKPKEKESEVKQNTSYSELKMKEDD